MFSVQVNFKTILKNVAHIKKKLRPGTKFCAVVKANAYGFGAVRISQLLQSVVDCFAVANVTEGITLRQAGITKDILVLGYPTEIDLAVKHQLILSVDSLDSIKKILAHPVTPRLHLSINTGMNRFGLRSIHELRTALTLLSGQKLTGIYTHFAEETDHPEQLAAAVRKFKKYVTLAKKYWPNLLVHAACSGSVDYLPAQFDLVRIGKALYGGTKDTQTVLTVQSKIVAIQKIKPSETVGYNGQFTATKPMLIGVVAGGYANGLPAQFQNTNLATVDDQPCPLIGRICMDYFFLDVSNIKNPLGKIVTILSPHPTQNLMAATRQTGMITCQLLLALNTTHGSSCD